MLDHGRKLAPNPLPNATDIGPAQGEGSPAHPTRERGLPSIEWQAPPLAKSGHGEEAVVVGHYMVLRAVQGDSSEAPRYAQRVFFWSTGLVAEGAEEEAPFRLDEEDHSVGRGDAEGKTAELRRRMQPKADIRSAPLHTH